ncbi:MAG: DUF6497 family protein [Roseovarius sp.]
MRGLAMGCAAVVIAAGARQAGAEEARIVLPSGLEAELQEALVEESGGGPVLRFRFVAPGLHKGAGLTAVSADLEHLCNAYALPNAPDAEATGATIIVSVGDRPSEFGVPDPEMVQVFEAYRVENGLCIWEVF